MAFVCMLNSVHSNDHDSISHPNIVSDTSCIFWLQVCHLITLTAGRNQWVGWSLSCFCLLDHSLICHWCRLSWNVFCLSFCSLSISVSSCNCHFSLLFFVLSHFFFVSGFWAKSRWSQVSYLSNLQQLQKHLLKMKILDFRLPLNNAIHEKGQLKKLKFKT